MEVWGEGFGLTVDCTTILINIMNSQSALKSKDFVKVNCEAVVIDICKDENDFDH